MEHKYVLWSTVGLSLGLGLGLGLAKGTIVKNSLPNKCLQSRELLQLELLNQIIDGKDAGVTFEQFPYYLDEQTRILLTNAAYVHLKQRQLTKFTRNLLPASQSILLNGPAGTEAYHQMLAKALAHYFEAKLLLLDISDFVSKFQAKYGEFRTGLEGSGGSISSVVVDHVGRLRDSLSSIIPSVLESYLTKSKSVSGAKISDDIRASVKVSEGLVPAKKQVSLLRRTTSWGFEDNALVTALFKVLSSLSETCPIVLYLRDVEKLIFRSPKTYMLFLRKMRKLSGAVLILGSRTAAEAALQEGGELGEELECLFPYSINIRPPKDNACLVNWRSQIGEDMKKIQVQDNRNHILEVLSANDVECDDLGSICLSDTLLLSNYIEEVVVSAISHHLMNTDEPYYRSGRLIISSKSLAFGLNLFQSSLLDNGDMKLQAEAKSEPKEAQGTTSNSKPEITAEVSSLEVKSDAKPETPKVDLEKKDPSEAKPAAPAAPAVVTPTKPVETPDNEFEKRIRPEVIPAGEVGVSFEDIGALDNVKETMQELVMLPLRRPDIFSKGGLLKPCKGILLFGPPGTGKTMIAKAVATEAGASFINVSMSSITSKWFGEDEKNVRALFTLAAKVAPTVIFIDEVDSMLGQRARVGEHEAMRKIKNEFMAHWDGLLTKGGERVLVLAATNRPFDLDDAIIRRFERRIMVGLPDTQNRENILRTILAKENLSEDFNFAEAAAMTEGYSGSDLKSLCVTAAYIPVREFLKKEKEVSSQKDNKDEVTSRSITSTAEASSDVKSEDKEKASDTSSVVATNLVALRALNIDDIKQARAQISASFSSEGSGMAELKEWNELYGEGGTRKRQQLSYFM